VRILRRPELLSCLGFDTEAAMTARERFEAARRAARAGRYEEALEGLLWFHHHALEDQPSLRGVRLSYALYEWANLGQVYPPARQALEDVREQAAQALLRGDGDRALFYEVVAIDEALGRRSATYELYVALADQAPELAAECAQLALPAIAAAKDYRLADRIRRDPGTRIREAADQLRWDMGWVKRRAYSRAASRWAFIKNYAADVRLDTGITTGVGRPDEARRLAALAVALVDDPSLRAAVRAEIARPSTTSPGLARLSQRRARARRREARRRTA
jgi:hypothetical protein